MSKYLVLALTLTSSSACFIQSQAQQATPEARHYRLTFVMDTGQGEAGKQSFVLDVPVTPGKTGAARADLVSGSNGDPHSLIQQLVECTDVHASHKGVAMHIAMQSDREAPAIPGLISARHQHGEFQRSVDLELGKPTVVTKEMTFRVLGNTDAALAEKLRQPASTITVTAETL